MTGLITGYPGELIRMATPVIAGLLLNSTLVAGSVLILLRLVKNRGSALQAAIVRGGLVALFCIPLVQVFMLFNGIVIPLPGLHTGNPDVVLTTNSPPKQVVAVPQNTANPVAEWDNTTVSGQQVSSDRGNGLTPDPADEKVAAGSSKVDDSYQQNASSPILLHKQAEILPHSEPQPLRQHNSGVFPVIDTQDEIVSGPASQQLLATLYVAVIAAWGLITLLMVIRMATGIWYVNHLRSTAALGRIDYQYRCRAIAQRLHIPPPLVYEHSRVFSTYIAGLTRPYIMVPANDRGALLASDEVFMHELAHQKHHDIHWHIIGQILLLLFPLQPLLWLLVRQGELISDYRADDYVVALAENNITYARTLHGIACALTVKNQGTRGYVPAISFFNRKSSLTTRIIRILDRDRNRPLSARIRDLVTLSVLLTCTVVFTGFVRFEPASEYDTGKTMGQQTPLNMTIRENSISELPISPYASTSEHVADDVSQGSTPPDTEQTSSNERIANHTSIHENNDVSAPSDTPLNDPNLSVTDVDIIPENPRSSMELAFIDPDGHKPDQATRTGSEYPGENKRSISEPEQMARQNTDGSYTADDVGDTETARIQEQTESTSDTASGTVGTGQLVDGENNPGAMFVFRGESLPALRSGTRIAIPTAKPVNVIIEEYDTEDYDLSDPEQRRQYLLYQSLEKNHNEPAWSPDGNWIAFTDFNRIWIVPAEGGEPRLLYENFHSGTNYTVGGIEALTYSSDGSTLTFQKNVYDTSRGSRFKEYDNGLAIFSKPVVNVESITIETGAHEVIVQDAYQCCWSPTGRYLFFLTWNKLDDPSQGNWEHHGQPMLLDTQTNTLRPIELPSDEQTGTATFLPDDSALIIPCRRDKLTDLWKIDLETGEQTNLTAGVPSPLPYRHYDYPACSPDEEWVLFTDFSAVGEDINRHLMLFSLTSNEIFPLEGEINGNASHGAWSPNGRKICFLEEEHGGSYLHVIDFYPGQYQLTKPAIKERESTQHYAFEITGNYPNPFNPVTRIEYGIEMPGPVSLTIINVIGQEVRRLVYEERSAGQYHEVWNGRDDQGMEVSAGIYFARLISNDRMKTLKMTLQK